jgi:hypothetical protein
MKIKNNLVINIARVALLFLFLSGCATSLPIAVERPPALNTSGINRIAVMPFQTSVNNAVYNETAAFAANTASAKFRGLGRFTVIDTNTIQQLLRNNQNIEGYVDALFRGQITRIGHRDSSEQIERTDKDGNVTVHTQHTRNVEIEFNYFFVRSRDGTIIGPVSKSGSSSATARDNPRELPTVPSMLSEIGRAHV